MYSGIILQPALGKAPCRLLIEKTLTGVATPFLGTMPYWHIIFVL